MKKYSFISLALLLLAAGFSGCSNEEASPNNQSGGKITINASVDQPTSRVAFKDEDGKLKMYWKDAADVEKFSLHYADATPGSNYLFIKGATTDAKSASFSCADGPLDTNGKTVYAVYPGVATSNAHSLFVRFNVADQPGKEATTSSTGDVGDFNFMVAEATVPQSGLGNVSLSFRHKVALVKMVLTFPDAVTGNITNISINSASMHNEGVYNLGTGSWAFTDDQKGSVSTKSDALFTLTNHQVTAWLAVLPEDLSAATDITITARVGFDDYITTMPGVSFDASKVYRVAKTMTKVKANYQPQYTKTNYFFWDAFSSVETGTNTFSDGNYGYNPATSGSAANSSKDSPTADQIRMYLGSYVYWDAGASNGTTDMRTYLSPDGALSSNSLVENHSGLWLRKKKYIVGFDTSTATMANSVSTSDGSLTSGRPVPEKIHEYFFLPAAGLYSSGNFSEAGVSGYYWSSSPNVNSAAMAYRLTFNANSASCGIDFRSTGFLPMVLE